MTGWMAVLATLVYICGLFAIAHFGDTTGRRFLAGRVRPVVYALGLCVYCTSWTFFGSVGFASRTAQTSALAKIPAPARTAREPQTRRAFEVTANDRRFLRSLRIAADETAEKQS